MTLNQLNQLNAAQLKEALSKCCGSTAWVEKMCAVFPVDDEQTLYKAAETIWRQCNETDWREAFTHHPKIGDIHSLKEKFAATGKWAEGEQSGVKQASEEVLEALAEGNKAYEEKFGYIFIVCATGKTAEEMLALLQSRLPNTKEEEIKIAMNEQSNITQIRLQKLLAS
jgi:2-oxo-4-hydroxy-4-carboxy-5-ureidoimidazoline decarboxylase